MPSPISAVDLMSPVGVKSSTGLTLRRSFSVKLSPLTTTRFSRPSRDAPMRRLCVATLFMSRVARVNTTSLPERSRTQCAASGELTRADLPGL